MKILDNETFEENKNYTDFLGILKYKIKFDDYTININTECSTNTLQKNNKSKKLVNLSDKFINYVKEIDEKRRKNSMKQNKFIIMCITFMILIITASYITVNMASSNKTKLKYNFDNLEVIKYYPFDNRKEKKINLNKTEKESLIEIINNEKFKEDKDITNCTGVLNYQIKFDIYIIDITTSCNINYLTKKDNTKKQVVLSKKLINFIKKY